MTPTNLPPPAHGPRVVAAGLEHGRLPSSWAEAPGGQATGAFCVHEYNTDCFVLRQSGRVHFEKPFLYLLFGAERVLLVDTGAPGGNLVEEIDRVLTSRARARGVAPLPLLVAHTHAHDDHVAGDAMLRARPETTVVGTSVEDVGAWCGIRRWPDDTGSIDLGGRRLDVVPVPGHEPSSVAFYDARTGILLTGDLLYPGRLYVRDAAAFRASVSRLVAFTQPRAVTHVLGAHIENTRIPYVDYPEGTREQPDEHELPLGRAHLLELHDALEAMAPAIERRALRDFTIWPVD